LSFSFVAEFTSEMLHWNKLRRIRLDQSKKQDIPSSLDSCPPDPEPPDPSSPDPPPPDPDPDPDCAIALGRNKCFCHF